VWNTHSAYHILVWKLELSPSLYQNMPRNLYDALTVAEMRSALGSAAFKSCKNKAMMLAIIPNLTDEQRATLHDVLRSKGKHVPEGLPGPSNVRDVSSSWSVWVSAGLISVQLVTLRSLLAALTVTETRAAVKNILPHLPRTKAPLHAALEEADCIQELVDALEEAVRAKKAQPVR
jgi:hypothetical protein